MDAGLGIPWKSGLDPQTFTYAFVGTEPDISSLNRGGGSRRGWKFREVVYFPPLPRFKTILVTEGDNVVRGRWCTASTPGSFPLGPSFCQERPEVEVEPTRDP